MPTVIQINPNPIRMSTLDSSHAASDLVMRLQIALAFAWQSLWSARHRIWLVVFGAAIGFGSLDSMLIIGSSVQARFKASLDSLGGDIVSIQLPHADDLFERIEPSGVPVARSHNNRTSLDLNSVSRLVEAQPEVASAAWAARRAFCISNKGDVRELDPVLIAIRVQEILSLKLTAGRLLHPADVNQSNLVLGSEAFERLRKEIPWLGIGSMVQHCGQRYRVVGLLQTHLGSDLVPELNINSSALIASSEVSSTSGAFSRTLLIRPKSGIQSQEYAGRLLQQLKPLLKGQRLEASGAWEFMKQRQEQVTLYARFLAVLGSVSLIVGIVGIMNMMLVSVGERRGEIGLRMAIGAERKDIVSQFLIEGMLICAAAGALGLLLAISVSWLALGLAGFEVMISYSVIIFAGVVALVCGIFAGIYPAYRAATIDPATTLRG
jgi:putative ABC transport system permease protein